MSMSRRVRINSQMMLKGWQGDGFKHHFLLIIYPSVRCQRFCDRECD